MDGEWTKALQEIEGWRWTPQRQRRKPSLQMAVQLTKEVVGLRVRMGKGFRGCWGM